MPQPFPQPRHPDDTPDGIPLIDIDTPHTTFVRLDPQHDHHDSPLRRALRRAWLRAPFGIGTKTGTTSPDKETPAP